MPNVSSAWAVAAFSPLRLSHRQSRRLPHFAKTTRGYQRTQRRELVGMGRHAETTRFQLDLLKFVPEDSGDAVDEGDGYSASGGCSGLAGEVDVAAAREVDSDLPARSFAESLRTQDHVVERSEEHTSE